jgi:Leucine-rich repeat (LRR) protein
MANNCNISNFAKNIINGSITGTQDIFSSKSLLQSYINRIGCSSVKEVFCVDSNITPCDKTVKKGCKFYISSLTKTSVSNGIEIGAVLSSTGVSPFVYLWSWDETLATLKSGSSAADSILKLEYIGGSAPQYLDISLKCKDSNGCIDTITERINTCVECTNKSFSVISPNNICKTSNITTIDGKEYFKVEMTAALLCNNDPAYISKLSKTALDIVGYQNDYPNGFTYSGGKFYFAIEKDDIALLETNEFRFRVQVKDCTYSWLEYTTGPGALACCHKCSNVTVSATNNNTCKEKVIVNNIEYYKFIIDVDLKCGTEDISGYISKIELDNNPNVEYYFEPTSISGTYNLFVKSEDFELMCNYTPPPPVVTYNFDIDADWANPGVTDQATFETFLSTQGATNIVITDFVLLGTSLKCNLTCDIVTYSMDFIQINSIDSIGVMNGLKNLRLRGCSLTTFDPSVSLPNTLEVLNLFNNQISTFNPSIALPNTLKTLNLQSNGIITFDPSIALPNALELLNLLDNQIVSFNPNIMLPISLTTLGLSANQMTLAGYTISETWATAQPSFTNACNVVIFNNIDSITGTNLETILLTKNTTITP